MGKAFSNALEVWDTQAIQDYYSVEINEGRVHDDEQLWYERDCVEHLAAGYMQKYDKHQREIELPAVDMNGTKFTGFIDGRMDYHNLVEDKLYGQWTDSKQEQLRINDQVTAYLAMYSLHTGIKVEELNLHYRVTRKPALRQKKGESYRDFSNRMAADIVDRHDHYFIEVPLEYTARTSEQCQEWFEETRQVGASIMAADAAQAWPKNTGSCMQFNSLCSMWDICSAANDEAAQIALNEKVALLPASDE